MELTCFEVEPGRVELRPAPRRRGWMDETPHSMAYRCVPLAVANEHGWEMLSPVSFEATWSGGAAAADLQIRIAEEDAALAADAVGANGQPTAGARFGPLAFVDSHFGCGILTFNPMVILRTPEGFNLWLGGPVNRFKDGIQAMSALIETDWMPYTFSVNWKITRPNTVVRFERGEPFCSFFPVPRGLVAACEPQVMALSKAKEIHDNYRWAIARRQLDSNLAEREQDIFQGWYAKGELPKRGAGSAKVHENHITVKPFTRID